LTLMAAIGAVLMVVSRQRESPSATS
jgi:hypothetical protein